MRRFRIIALTLLAFVTNARAADGVYFWRIQRGGAGERAIAGLVAETGVDAARPLLLAAEIYRENGKILVRRADIAGSPSLRKMKRPVSLVLRINRLGGDFAADDTRRALILAEILRARAALLAAGTMVDEVQLDFDCPVSRLRDYGDLLRTIRPELGGLRLTVTGMPAWLDSPDLPALLSEVDGWTLQVHLTDLTKNETAPPPLCDTAKARRWAAAAAKLGKNFRLALPTYAYRTHFDASGKFLALESETGATPAASARSYIWEADTEQLARLVRDLLAKPPAHLEGLAWYRLPCDDDRLNLTPSAFAKLRRGEAPEPGRITARTVPAPDDAHVVDLFLENIGELDADAPIRLVVHAPQPKFNDLPGALRIEYQKPDTLTVYPAPRRLRPGERRRLGWMRFTDPITPEFSTVTETPSPDSAR